VRFLEALLCEYILKDANAVRLYIIKGDPMRYRFFSSPLSAEAHW